MKLALAMIASLLPAPLLAENAFERMIGTWNGAGQYSDGVAQVNLRCRINIAGTPTSLQLSGRCGSSLGAETFAMDFALGGDRVVRLQRSQSERGADSAVGGLSGPIGDNGMVVKGTAPGEEVVVQLLLNPDGSLVFATREVNGSSTTVSHVTLSR